MVATAFAVLAMHALATDSLPAAGLFVAAAACLGLSAWDQPHASELRWATPVLGSVRATEALTTIGVACLLIGSLMVGVLISG